MRQLGSLIADRKSFITGDSDTDKYFKDDIAAIAYLIRENKLSGKKLIEKEKKIKTFKQWLEKLLKEMENTPADDLNQQVEKDSCLSVVDAILIKVKELEG